MSSDTRECDTYNLRTGCNGW